MFSIDQTGRLFIKNESLILSQGNFYRFNIGKSRIEIEILSKELTPCSLKRLNNPNENEFIGIIETKNPSRKKSFVLLNYHHLFSLHPQHGLLTYQTIENDLVLLIDIENARCLLKITRRENYSNTSKVILKLIILKRDP